MRFVIGCNCTDYIFVIKKVSDYRHNIQLAWSALPRVLIVTPAVYKHLVVNYDFTNTSYNI